jgi:hypothetical protein
MEVADGKWTGGGKGVVWMDEEGCSSGGLWTVDSSVICKSMLSLKRC